MQCKNCGSKWETKVEVAQCPFCKQSLLIQNKLNDMGISDAIAYIISIRSIEILKDSKVVNSYIMDLVRGHEREKRLFKILSNYNVLEGAYKIIVTTDSFKRDVIIKRQYSILIEDAFLPERVATEALNIVLRGIGVKELTVTGTNLMSDTNFEPCKKDTYNIPNSKKENIVEASVSSQNKNASQNNSAGINTFYMYQRELEKFYLQVGKRSLTELDILYFITLNSLDKKWGITVDDVKKDLTDVYLKYVYAKNPIIKSVTVNRMDPAVSTNMTLFTSNKHISTYNAYMDELECAFVRNGKVKLSKVQINEFINVYSLNKKFGITISDVESDLREIMRKY